MTFSIPISFKENYGDINVNGDCISIDRKEYVNTILCWNCNKPIRVPSKEHTICPHCKERWDGKTF